MENQFALFESNPQQAVIEDIRILKQTTKNIAYDCGAKINGIRKEMAALRKAFDRVSAKTPRLLTGNWWSHFRLTIKTVVSLVVLPY
jgi:hypothetical protein